jgi:hypothetical protein
MAKKNPDLSQALKTLDNRVAPAPPAEKPASIERTDNPHYRPSRQGMENLTGYFPPEVKNQLMELSIERRRAVAGKVTIQDLMAEALNELFAKYGKPEIAPVNRKEGQG